MIHKHVIIVDFYFDVVPVNEEYSVQKILDDVLKEISVHNEFEAKPLFQNCVEDKNFTKFNHITFIEITKANPCFMLHSGYLYARNASFKLLNEKVRNINLPERFSSDIVIFDNLHDFLNEKEFKDLIKKILQNEISHFYDSKKYIHKLWYGFDQKQVYVVSGPDDKKSADELRNLNDEEKETLNDSIYNYGDKDTLFDVCIFLSKYMNEPILKRRISTDKIDVIQNNKEVSINKSENLLIIGGPGRPDDIGNILCKEMMDMIRSRFSYGHYSDSEKSYYYLSHNSKNYVATELEKDKVIKDYGYFACFKNPFNQNKRVILINGIHTIGVWGAFKIFSDDPRSKKNYKILLNKILKSGEIRKLADEEMFEFECFFEVETDENMEPKMPEVKSENIFFFDNKNQLKLLSSKKNDSIEEAQRKKVENIKRIIINEMHEDIPTKYKGVLKNFQTLFIDSVEKNALTDELISKIHSKCKKINIDIIEELIKLVQK